MTLAELCRIGFVLEPTVAFSERNRGIMMQFSPLGSRPRTTIRTELSCRAKREDEVHNSLRTSKAGSLTWSSSWIMCGF